MAICVHCSVPPKHAEFLSKFHISPSGILQDAIEGLMKKFAPESETKEKEANNAPDAPLARETSERGPAQQSKEEGNE